MVLCCIWLMGTSIRMSTKMAKMLVKIKATLMDGLTGRHDMTALFKMTYIVSPKRGFKITLYCASSLLVFMKEKTTKKLNSKHGVKQI